MRTNLTSHGGIPFAAEVRKVYQEGQTDYYIEPLLRTDPNGEALGRIGKNDSVIFCCRRGEREIELTEAFTEDGFSHFSREKIENLYFSILTMYHEKFRNLPVAFAPSKITKTLAEVISAANRSQFHCAESEKFAHVTFFLNGGNNQPFLGEIDDRIPSPQGIPFEQVPALSLETVTQHILAAIKTRYDFIVTNFANGDVIGHTSNTEAKIKCAEYVDTALQEVVESAFENNYVVLITADHGNLEELLTKDGKPHVSHTTNQVPFFLINPQIKNQVSPKNGKLADIAPTILQLMNIQKPDEMSGLTLLDPFFSAEYRKVMLIILDGWGLAPQNENNPIFVAKTPYWDYLNQKFRCALLDASGEAVGLQPGKAGNSEAGHMNIGAGRIVPQDDVRLDLAMSDGSFFTNEIFLKAIEHAKTNQSNLHLIALLTEKSSHGSIDYPLALLKLAKDQGLQEVYVHLIFDGRSTEPGSAPDLLEKM
ncbi:MAG: sulfatase-like hydrolase/transferase, partial [Anaerolineaceae bacterium]|nr:sulfatase-like hydrolase/transferase [Anaerolineaceae bacterium]